ncbi:MAG: spermidine synthase, partial [Gammaproteobacteria bacterium]|nr:spermidine synthase [Gammaproteobacteria bacterium]
EVIDHLESLDGGLTTVHDFSTPDGKSFKVLLTNGKFQGTDDIKGEMIPQLSIGLVPLMHTDARNNALVIGYGTGATARILHEAGFDHMDVVDISKDIFVLADEYFQPVNNGVTEMDNVDKYVTDGRNFLLLSEKKYDLISIQISSIWFAGAASLYNREFYQLVQRNLTPDGVLQQWVQLHHATPYDLVYIIGTLRSVFDYVRLYIVGGQGILVASMTPDSDPSEAAIQALQEIPYVRYLAGNGVDAFSRLQNTLLMRPDDINRLIKTFTEEYGRLPVSDNDNSILEYSTPKSNVLDSSTSYKQNIEWLSGFRSE